MRRILPRRSLVFAAERCASYSGRRGSRGAEPMPVPEKMLRVLSARLMYRLPSGPKARQPVVCSSLEPMMTGTVSRSFRVAGSRAPEASAV